MLTQKEFNRIKGMSLNSPYGFSHSEQIKNMLPSYELHVSEGIPVFHDTDKLKEDIAHYIPADLRDVTTIEYPKEYLKMLDDYTLCYVLSEDLEALVIPVAYDHTTEQYKTLPELREQLAKLNITVSYPTKFEQVEDYASSYIEPSDYRDYQLCMDNINVWADWGTPLMIDKKKEIDTIQER